MSTLKKDTLSPGASTAPNGLSAIDIEKLLDALSLDDLCGQLLNLNVSGKTPLDEFEEMVKRVRPGAIFVSRVTPQQIKDLTDIVNKYTKVPVIVSADIENGAGCCLWDTHVLPEPMAWGACDDEDLIRKAGQVTGEICGGSGIHWNFAPIVDLNYNMNNPVTNTRTISDSPKPALLHFHQSPAQGGMDGDLRLCIQGNVQKGSRLRYGETYCPARCGG